MDAELRQVANGFDDKVRSFDKYDINGYRFRTYGKDLSMADRKSTNCFVSAIGEGDVEYYGRVEAIYELQFYGKNPLRESWIRGYLDSRTVYIVRTIEA